jgi:hypothetical protein
MPLGMCNFRLAFNRIMNMVLQVLLEAEVCIYLDDILIRTYTYQRHIEGLCAELKDGYCVISEIK